MSKTAVYGGAGCGKTTYLIEEVRKVAETTHLRSVCMMTLTRNARDEFVERTATSTGAETADMKWFSTMHSVAWKLCGLNSDNYVEAKDKTLFKDEFGYSTTPAMFAKLGEMDSTRRNCCCELTVDGFKQAAKLTGVSRGYKNDDSKRWGNVTYAELVSFGEAWEAFTTSAEIYDYTGAIERAIEVVTADGFVVPFTKLFVDEFQDFSPLQHRLFVELSNAVEDVWVCGDDWQTIFRFAGARPDYLIDGDWDDTVVLPKTYRYGDAILENSLRYIRPLSVKFDRDIEPADHDSVYEHLRYDDWITRAKKCSGDTVYLARSAKGVAQISKQLSEIGVQHTILGTKSGAEKLGVVYNTIVALGAGEDVTPDAVQMLIAHLPTKVSSETFGAKAVPYMRTGVKVRAKAELFVESPDRAVWDAETFAEDFLAGNVFDATVMLSNIKGMSKFLSSEHVRYPAILEFDISNRVGTIHRFKGNEADTVFLFAQIPYPFSDGVHTAGKARDDELRTFYVGATRAKHTLYEISDYLCGESGYNKGIPHMNVSALTG